ncbi:hypothetical protein TWF730_000141 [Orbilia blumenaviensis]|uniref:Uncharacterized protein n=1 Tax=Orbilia blumenaviensis TaxID=1796055 RepID=A0AAV9VMT7_9PEZI
MEDLGKILGPTFGIIFVLFILSAMMFLWRQGYQSEREMEKERASLEQAQASAREDEERVAFKAVAFDTLSQSSSPPPYTQYAAPRVPEPAVVRVTS